MEQEIINILALNNLYSTMFLVFAVITAVLGCIVGALLIIATGFQFDDGFFNDNEKKCAIRTMLIILSVAIITLSISLFSYYKERKYYYIIKKYEIENKIELLSTDKQNR